MAMQLVMVENLVPGTTYRLRAAAIGAVGQSAWSSPVIFIAI